MIRSMLQAVAIAMLLASTPSRACFLELGMDGGLSTSDPLTIPVLVAAREQAAKERIDWFSSRDTQAVSIAVLRLSALPRILNRTPIETDAAPAAFSMIQVQTGYWTRYRIDHDGTLSAEGHRDGPAEGDVVIAVSDSALLAILRGRLDLDAARELGLVRGRGESIEAAMETLTAIVAAFRVASARQVNSAPPRPPL